MLPLPLVVWLPNAGSALACSILTLVQSASSSSARIIASAVRTPWPTSERCTVRVTVPSASMLTKRFGANGGSALPPLAPGADPPTAVPPPGGLDPSVEAVESPPPLVVPPPSPVQAATTSAPPAVNDTCKKWRRVHAAAPDDGSVDDNVTALPPGG